jgi:TPR repeat protein
LKALADKGDQMMEFYAGTLYDSTLNISKTRAPDMPTAMRYYLASAEKGNALAAYNYGKSLAFGTGVPRDTSTGVEWLTKAADDNYALAARALGMVYKGGVGVPVDMPQALQWFQKAADSGDNYSQSEIGAAYWDGISPYRKDHAEALSWYRKAAVDPTEFFAARMLGIAYQNGDGAPQNAQEALQWFQKAANNGDGYSQTNIAFAADPSQSGAARSVGIAYRDGIGVPVDIQTALEWFQKGANEGDHYSQTVVGDAYWNGTPPYIKNYATAVSWFLKAAADPSLAATARQLGIAYRDGDGVPVDFAQARRWFKQAAAHGDKLAARLERKLR